MKEYTENLINSDSAVITIFRLGKEYQAYASLLSFNALPFTLPQDGAILELLPDFPVRQYSYSSEMSG